MRFAASSVLAQARLNTVHLSSTAAKDQAWLSRLITGAKINWQHETDSKKVEMSNGRSLAGTSLASETSARQILCFQGFAPRFPESLDPADTSGNPPFGQSLATLTMGGEAASRQTKVCHTRGG